tara:strand:+ start:209 stop:328 length:120 start_codon:yes stop_codon:yes gene_type:complete
MIDTKEISEKKGRAKKSKIKRLFGKYWKKNNSLGSKLAV